MSKNKGKEDIVLLLFQGLAVHMHDAIFPEECLPEDLCPACSLQMKAIRAFSKE